MLKADRDYEEEKEEEPKVAIQLGMMDCQNLRQSSKLLFFANKMHTF